MIVDLFKDWKTNTEKQNVLNLIGLFIAGVGVLLTILPVWYSASQNTIVSEVSEGNFTFRHIALTVLGTFSENSLVAIFGLAESTLLMLFITDILSYIFVFIVILMRHYKKSLIMTAFFCVFYIVSTELMWVVIPNRAYCFILTFVCVFWLGINDNQEKHRAIKSEIKSESVFISKIYKFVVKADKQCKKTISVLLSVLLFLTVPISVCELVRDYSKSFASSKEPAEYMMSHFKKGTVFVMDEDEISQICAYLPTDYFKFYCARHNEFHKTKSYKEKPDKFDYERIRSDLESYEELYFLRIIPKEDFFSDQAIYAYDEASPYTQYYIRLEIFDISTLKELLLFYDNKN